MRNGTHKMYIHIVTFKRTHTRERGRKHTHAHTPTHPVDTHKLLILNLITYMRTYVRIF